MEQRELSVRALAYFALCLVCAACSRAPERDLFKEGETLFLNGEYDAAVEVFKQRLVQDPNDAGAHFYLGTCCFYNTDNNWLGIALGELETALSLFERQGKVNPVPRFSAEYFEMICHVNQAYIYYSLIGFLADNPRQFGGVDARALAEDADPPQAEGRPREGEDERERHLRRMRGRHLERERAHGEAGQREQRAAMPEDELADHLDLARGHSRPRHEDRRLARAKPVRSPSASAHGLLPGRHARWST